MIDFERGKPHEDGQYLAFVKDLKSPEWVKPVVLTWHRGRWYYPKSDAKFWELVYLWNGPLPCGRLDDYTLVKADYDL